MNLYLYIPAASSHPSGMIIGVINRLIWRFHLQNSKQKEFVNLVVLLYKRLAARGWDATSMRQLILTAITKLQQHSKATTQSIQQQPNQNGSIFLHLQYHQNDIPRIELRTIYEKNCKHLEQLTTKKGKELSLTSFTIAYSRTKNLHDILNQPSSIQSRAKKKNTTLDSEHFLGCTNPIVSIGHPQIFYVRHFVLPDRSQ